MEVRTTGVPVIGEKELRRAAEILRRYKQGRQNLERRIIADEDWWKLRQWRQFADKGNPNDDRPASGWLFNVIMGKHADAIAAYPGPNIRPREPDDRMEAQMLSSILPCILEQNDFEEVYSDTCWQKMKQGTGVWGVYWDQEKLGGLGDISIRPVNVLNLVWEPGVTDIQKSQNVFYLELEDNETLLAAYPQLAGKLGGSSGLLARYRTDDAVDLSEKTLVVDWYYKKRVEGRTVLHYCKYVGQTVLYATENDTFVPSVTREEVDERGERRLVQVPVRGPACERGLYDDGEYPFIFDRLFPIEGSICGYGYIDIGKGAQEQIDRMDQAIVKNTIMSATPRWFRRADGSVNEQEYADWTKPFVHVDGNLGQDSLQQVQVRTLPAVCVQVLNSKIEELKWTTGNTDVTNGQVSSGVTAASAIAALQEASGRSSRAATRSAYRAYARMIRMVIERIRQFYDLPRKFRILGAGGAEEYVSYCNVHLKAQSLGADGLLRTPVFDVTVTTQKHTEYTKLAQNELALQFFQLGFFRPGMEQQALACLDMMDFDGKEQVLQKIRGGTQDALWQRMALTLAQRYEPELFASLTDSAQGMRADVRLEGEKAPAQVRQARKRAAEAAQPE
nr:MAG TPA: portal protein [Caudoviricetes sp.]